MTRRKPKSIEQDRPALAVVSNETTAPVDDGANAFNLFEVLGPRPLVPIDTPDGPEANRTILDQAIERLHVRVAELTPELQKAKDDPRRIEELSEELKRIDHDLLRLEAARDDDKPLATETNGASITLGSVDHGKPQPINWIDENWWHYGGTFVFGGAPGSGKTTLSAALGARLSRGLAGFTDARLKDGPAVVLFFSQEEHFTNRFLPKFVRAGGDPTRLRELRDVQGLFPALTPALKKTVALVRVLYGPKTPVFAILDTAAALIDADLNKDQETRKALTDLAVLVMNDDLLTVALVSHTSKVKEAFGQNAISGSAGGLVAVVRNVWVAGVASHPIKDANVPGETDDQPAFDRALGLVKSSNGDDDQPVRLFRIEHVPESEALPAGSRAVIGPVCPDQDRLSVSSFRKRGKRRGGERGTAAVQAVSLEDAVLEAIDGGADTKELIASHVNARQLPGLPRIEKPRTSKPLTRAIESLKDAGQIVDPGNGPAKRYSLAAVAPTETEVEATREDQGGVR